MSTWIAGIVVGVGAGVLALAFPALGWLIVVAFLVGVIPSRPRIPAVGGLVLGFGTSWLALLGRSHVDCQAFDAAPNQDCIEPDIGPWLAVGGVLLAIGVVLTLVAVIGARRLR